MRRLLLLTVIAVLTPVPAAPATRTQQSASSYVLSGTFAFKATVGRTFQRDPLTSETIRQEHNWTITLPEDGATGKTTIEGTITTRSEVIYNNQTPLVTTGSYGGSGRAVVNVVYATGPYGRQSATVTVGPGPDESQTVGLPGFRSDDSQPRRLTPNLTFVVAPPAAGPSEAQVRGENNAEVIGTAAPVQTAGLRTSVLDSVTIAGRGKVEGDGVTCKRKSCVLRRDITATRTLTAVPNPLSEFAAWQGCDSVTGAVCTVAGTAPRQLVARFRDIPCVFASGRRSAQARVRATVSCPTEVDIFGRISVSNRIARKAGLDPAPKVVGTPAKPMVLVGRGKARGTENVAIEITMGELIRRRLVAAGLKRVPVRLDVRAYANSRQRLEIERAFSLGLRKPPAK